MSQNSKTVGVIGLGSIGLRHATNLQSLGINVVAFDPFLTQQDKFKAQGGQVASKQDVIDQSQWVVIASPSQYHKDDLKQVITAGKHAFVEKPLAHTLSGLKELAIEAEQRQIIVGMGMNIRLNPAVKMLRDKISAGQLGDVLWGRYWLSSYLPDWRPGNDYRQGYAADPKTGGIIFDAIHGYDVMYHLLGDYAVTGAQAISSGTLDIASDDCADISCRHDNNVLTTLHMDFMSRPKIHTITVNGTSGRTDIDISNRHIRIVDVKGVVIEDKSFTDTAVNDDYKEELALFHKAVNEGAIVPCSLAEGIAVLAKAIEARKLAGLPYAD